MKKSFIKASAPGSIMLMGEHAVLHGKRAIVCAVSRRLEVTLEPSKEKTILIQSDLGESRCTLDNLQTTPPHQFVLAAILQKKAQLKTGFTLTIKADFPSTIGFGSSAAVSVATTAALTTYLGDSINQETLFEESVQVIRSIQGIGSGADVAASVYGGAIVYRAEPKQVTPLPSTYPLTLIYSGSKMPTVEVIERVEANRKQASTIFDHIYNVMDKTVDEAAGYAHRSEWDKIGALMNINQGLMDAIGVNNATLSNIVYALRDQPSIHGAKISGSGLGDCVVALGHAPNLDIPYQVIEAEMAPQGVAVE